MSKIAKKPVFKKHLYIPTSKIKDSDFTQTMTTTIISENDRKQTLEGRFTKPENKVLKSSVMNTDMLNQDLPLTRRKEKKERKEANTINSSRVNSIEKEKAK